MFVPERGTLPSPGMRLHLVDGTYELFRAHFSRRPSHQGPDGTPLKATVGLVVLAPGAAADPVERPTHLAVAFDNPIRSFRNDLFDGYKTEEGVPEELLAQFDLVELATRAAGHRGLVDARLRGRRRAGDRRGAVRVTGGAGAHPHPGQGPRASASAARRWCRSTGCGSKVIDEAALRALRGIGPESIPDWLALVGDTADGIPGLPGFGEKGAAAVLAAFGHLEAIPGGPARLAGLRALRATFWPGPSPSSARRRSSTARSPRCAPMRRWTPRWPRSSTGESRASRSSCSPVRWTPRAS